MTKLRLLALPYNQFIKVPETMNLELLMELLEGTIYEGRITYEGILEDFVPSKNNKLCLHIVDYQEPSESILNIENIVSENNRLTRKVQELEEVLEASTKSDSKEIVSNKPAV